MFEIKILKRTLPKLFVLAVMVSMVGLLLPTSVSAADTITGLTITAPAEGAKIAGTYNITWTVTGSLDGDEKYNVHYYDPTAASYIVIQNGIAHSGATGDTQNTNWNTAGLDEIAGYKVKVQCWEVTKTQETVAGNTNSLTIDNTLPTITKAWQYDMDGDGNIDEVVIEFSESMKDSSIVKADVISAFTVGGTAVVNIDTTTDGAGTAVTNAKDPGVANDKYITIVTDDATVIGTDAKATAFTAASNKFEDSAGNDTATNGTVTTDDQAGPIVTKAEGEVGTDQVVLTFSENVYNATGSPASPGGDLATDDFTIVDSDNSRTITGITHAAGTSTATLTLSAVLDSTTDIGTDTIAFAGSAAYDAADNAGATTTATIDDTTVPTISNAYYIDDNSDGVVDYLKIVFSEYVNDSTYLNKSSTLSVIGSSLTTTGIATPAVAGDTPNDDTIYLAIVGATADTTYYLDASFDTVASAMIKDFGSSPNELADTPATAVTDQAGPIVTKAEGEVGTDQVVLTFSENVYNATGSPASPGGDLATDDFTIVDSDNSRTITGITHAAGTSTATLTLSAVLDSTTDIGTDTIAFAGSAAYDAADNAGATTTATIDDTTVPTISNAYYIDDNSDGVVDYLKIVFSEYVNDSTYLNKSSTLSVIGSSLTTTGIATPAVAGDTPNDDTIYLAIVGATADTTYYLDASFDTVASAMIKDFGSSPNELADTPTTAVTDQADPILVSMKYLDADGNGTVDKLELTLSEAITTNSAAIADFTYVAQDITGSVLTGGSNGGETAAVITLVLGTPGNANITGHSTAPTLAYTKSAGSIQDAANNELANFTVANLSDGAGPILVSMKYLDADGNGTVDKLELTLSEAISTNSAAIADFTYVAQDITGSVLTGGSNGGETAAVITLVLGTPGNANITSHSTAPTLAYTKSAGSIQDAANNELANFTVANLSDGAGPIITKAEGEVGTDQVVLTFSENVYNATGSPASPGGDLATDDFTIVDSDNSRTITGITHAAGTSTATLTLSAVLDSTTDIGTDTIAFAGSAAYDAADNAGATTTATIDDTTVPTISNAYYIDDNSDGVVDYLKIVFSEYVNDSTYLNKSSTLSVIGSSLTTTGIATPAVAGDTPNDDTIYLAIVGATADTTYYLDASFDTVASAMIKDFGSSPNELADTPATAVTDQAGPIVTKAEGEVGTDQVVLTFSENVYNATGSPASPGGDLATDDFTIVDSDNSRTITGITHAAGTSTATLTLSAVLDSTTDIGTDTIAFAGSAAYDAADNAGATTTATIDDTTVPTISNAYYIDDNSDGVVDYLKIVFSEYVNDSTYLNKSSTLSVIGSSLTTTGIATPAVAGDTPNDDTIYLAIVGATADTTYYSGANFDTVLAGMIKDFGSSPNELADTPTTAVTDQADPILVSMKYLDADGNGTVDKLELTLSEAISTNSAAIADFTYVAQDITGSVLTGGSNGGETAAVITLVLGTPGNANITGHSTAPTLAYTKSAGSIQDAANNELANFTVANLSDGAGPILVSMKYLDADGNGTVDKLELTLSEAISTNSAAIADFTYVAQDITGSVLTGGSNGGETAAVITLVLGTPGNANITSHSTAPTLAYTKSAGSIQDAANNELANFTVANLSDGAGPIITKAEGEVGTDQVVLTFSENVYNATGSPASPGGDLATDDFTIVDSDNSRTITGITHAAGTSTATLTLSAVLDSTTDIGTDTIAFAGSAAYDAADNAGATTTATIDDTTVPTISNAYYIDDNSDGVVDYLKIVFSEYVNDSTYLNKSSTLSVIGSSLTTTGIATPAVAGDTPNDDTIYLAIVGATADTTYYLDASFDTVASAMIKDFGSSPNELADTPATAVTDQAGPILVSMKYLDADGNGTVDKLELTLSEAISTNSAAIADFTYVAQDITGSVLTGGSNGGETAAVITLVLGTPGNANITGHSTAPTLAYTKSAGSIQDAANNELANFTVANLSDGAGPILVSMKYLDADGNGTVDKLELTLSEAISTNSAAIADFTYVAQDITGSVLTGGSNGGETAAVITLVLGTPGNANITSHSTAPTLAYTKSAGSIQDAANNELANFTVANLSDGAGPIITKAEGEVGTDQVVLTFSENVYNATGSPASPGGDLATDDFTIVDSDNSRTITGITHAAGTSTATLTLSAVLDSTTDIGTDTIAFAGSAAYDAADNAGATTTATIDDTTVPTISNAYYIDDNSDGVVDYLKIVFSEYVNDSTYLNKSSTLSVIGSSLTTTGIATPAVAGDTPNDDTIYLAIVGATADTTYYLDASFDTVASAMIKDFGSSPNELADTPATAVTDQAGPILVSMKYLDADGNGTVDKLELTLSEAISTNSAAIADFTYVAQDITGSVLTGGSNGGETAAVITLVLGTPGNANITGHSTAPTLAYTKSAGSIQDAANNELANFTVANLSDGAGPILVSMKYLDADGNGTVDKLELTLSEAISTNSAAIADFTYVAQDITGSVLTGGSNGGETAAVITLVLGTPGNANITSHSTAPTLAYTKSAGSIQDAANNELANFTVANLSDGAGPTMSSATPTGIRTVAITFSEDIDSTTVTYDDFTIDGIQVVGTVTSGDIVTLTSAVDLTWSSLSKVHLLTGKNVADIAGNTLSGATTVDITGGSAVVSSIANITPDNAFIAEGQTITYVVTVNYNNGTSGTVTSGLSWDSSNTGVALAPDGSRQTIGLAVGTTTVTATHTGKTASTTLSVSDPTLSLIAVTPATPIVAKGTTQQFVVTGTYSNGNTNVITSQASWVSTTPAVATIDANGLATAVATTGDTVITATILGLTDTATLTASAKTVSSVAITPDGPTITGLSETQTFVATAAYTDGTFAPVTAVWESSDVGVATIVAGTGVATTVAKGATTITATVGSIVTTTSLSVSDAVGGGAAVGVATPILILSDQTGSYAGSYARTDSATVNVLVTNDGDAGDPANLYWYISESATKPLPGAGGWAAEPTTYLITDSGTDGEKTVYVWIKNSSGTVSGNSGSATINLVANNPTNPSSHTIVLKDGKWNTFSVPKVVDSFSADTDPVSITLDGLATKLGVGGAAYILDGGNWLSLSGRTNPAPLYGYLIKNMSGADITLTITYDTDPGGIGQNYYLSRNLTSGWSSVGVADPEQSLSQTGVNISTDTSDSIFSEAKYIVDYTDNANSSSVAFSDDGERLRVKGESGGLAINPRETRGYLISVMRNTTLTGYQR